MRSLLLRNLFFTILQPGLVAGFFPYWMVRGQLHLILNQSWQPYHYLGIITTFLGFVILMMCIFRFAFEGKGTLSPLDETKRLVIGGLYTYSRNPMYVGVMLMLIGETLFTQSQSLLMYSLIIFICFNLFIIFHEEKRLQRDFGDSYSEYRKKVRRWL